MLKNRNMYSLFLVVCFMGFMLMGCSTESQIAPADLTRGQQDIVDLLSFPNSEILLFDFNTTEGYETMEIWLEVYEYGVLTEHLHGLQAGYPEAGPRDGQLAIIINSENDMRDFHWTFIYSHTTGDSSGVVSSKLDSPTTIGIDSDELLGRGPAFMYEPAIIRDGEDIILYLAKFTRDGMMSTPCIGRFLEQPDWMEEYPYVHILKTRFSR